MHWHAAPDSERPGHRRASQACSRGTFEFKLLPGPEGPATNGGLRGSSAGESDGRSLSVPVTARAGRAARA